LMHNEGEIIAIDRYESRLKILRKNMERLGITCVKTVETDTFDFTDGKFDRVLTDVSCSGSGTLRKKPDIKWKHDLLDLRRMSELQYKLLEKASTLVNDGGYIVYSTCSIEPEENFGIVGKFLENHNEFKLGDISNRFPQELIDENGCIQTLPHVHKSDGAFAAKLIKNN